MCICNMLSEKVCLQKPEHVEDTGEWRVHTVSWLKIIYCFTMFESKYSKIYTQNTTQYNVTFVYCIMYTIRSTILINVLQLIIIIIIISMPLWILLCILFCLPFSRIKASVIFYKLIWTVTIWFKINLVHYFDS